MASPPSRPRPGSASMEQQEPEPSLEPEPKPGLEPGSGRAASSDPAGPWSPRRPAAAPTTTRAGTRRPPRSAGGWIGPPRRRQTALMRIRPRVRSSGGRDRPSWGCPPMPSDSARRRTTRAPATWMGPKTRRHRREVPARWPDRPPTARSPPRSTPRSRTVAMRFHPWEHSLRFDGATAPGAPIPPGQAAAPGRSSRMPIQPDPIGRSEGVVRRASLVIIRRVGGIGF